MAVKINDNEQMTIKKICNILKIDVPDKYKDIENKKINEITRWNPNIKKNSIIFMVNIDPYNDKIYDRIKKNALLVFADHKVKDINTILVKDPLEEYTKVIKYIKDNKNVNVIAVTGSLGKTSTKDMIYYVLKQKYKNMYASKGNSNSQIQVAEHITKLTKENEIFLQEVGISSYKPSIISSTKMLNADVVVYTSILEPHIDVYGSFEEIVKYKTSLSKYGNQNGLAIINYDYEILRNHKFTQKTISYSIKNEKADFYAKDIIYNSTKGIKFTIVDNINKTSEKAYINVLGEHNIENALAAFAVGKYYNIPNKLILKGIKKYKTYGTRQNIIKIDGYTIFADCYNACVESIESAAKTLEIMKIPKGKKKIAVIGDVLGLADLKKSHKQIGKNLSKYNFDIIVFFGDNSKYTYNEYKKYKNNAIYINDREKLHEKIKEIISPGDIILFKASHKLNFINTIDTIFGTNISNKTKKKVSKHRYIYTKFPILAKLKKHICKNIML